jgi:hypothetical protein
MSGQEPPKSDQDNGREVFWNTIDEIHFYSEQIKNSVDPLSRIASFGLDYTNRVRASGFIPPNTNYGAVNGTLMQYRDSLGQMASAVQPLTTYTGGTLTYGATAINNIIHNMYSDETIKYLSFDDQEKAKQERTWYYNITLRDDRKEQVIDLLKQLGFDHRDEGKRKILNFTNAWDEYSSSPALYNTAFLAMREAMKDILNELGMLCIPRKTTDQAHLIIYVGEKLGAIYSDRILFESISADWVTVFNRLQTNEAKKGTYSAAETHEIMGDAVLLLIRLLSSIDSQKISR